LWVVLQIIGFTVGLLIAVAGGMVAGFRWLRRVIAEEFKALASSWDSSSERRHQSHETAIKELRERDLERAGAIKRLHARVDTIWEKVGPR
jgi:hypothetical protein